MTTGFARDRIEKIDKIKEDEGAGGWGVVVVEVGFKLGMGEVDNKVHAARDFDSVLTVWSKDSGDFVGHDVDREGSGYASEGGANTNRAEFVKVVKVFMKGDKILAREVREDGAGKGVINNVVDECIKVVKKWVGFGTGGREKGVLTEEVSRIGERAGGGATAELLKGGTKIFGGKMERRLGVAGGRAGNAAGSLVRGGHERPSLWVK